jgi:hypothetical protein
MNEHRRAVNVMSILVNKAVGIDTLYNGPVKLEGGQKIRANRKEIKEYDPKAHQIVLLDLSVLNEDDDHEDDDDTDPSTKTKIKEIATSRFPKEEFEELFVETESHLKGSFNIREMADRLFAISNTLYRTYLFYNQNLDVQTYLESQLDKKYRINTTPVTRVETRELIEEAIEEGLRNNIIDMDF